MHNLCFYICSGSRVPISSVLCLYSGYSLLQEFPVQSLFRFKRFDCMLNRLSLYCYSYASVKVRQTYKLASYLIQHILIGSLRMRDCLAGMGMIVDLFALARLPYSTANMKRMFC